jgi:hypothetical protein
MWTEMLHHCYGIGRFGEKWLEPPDLEIAIEAGVCVMADPLTIRLTTISGA